MRLGVRDILEATGGILHSGREDFYFSGISIDSRTINKGELFVAIKGRNFDGHDFIAEALRKGAVGVLVERIPPGLEEGVIITLPDTLKGLGDIGRYIRSKLSVPVIGITGSNGKTTTKEMVATILDGSYRVLKNLGNLNNLIGVPLTLFRYQDEDIIVLELGINQPGEMKRLVDISLPDLSLITNINIAHLEYLKDIKRLAYEKGEIFRALRPDGVAVINADDPLILELADSLRCKKVTYGVRNRGDVYLVEVLKHDLSGMTLRVRLFGKDKRIDLPLFGRHNIYNVLASIAISGYLGIDPELIKERLEGFKGYPMRMEVLRLKGDIRVINDAYNANPSSMECALKCLFEIKGRNRGIAVLGDMLELGEFAERAHREIGRMVSGFDFLFLMGEYSNLVADSACSNGMERERIFVMESHRDLAHKLMEILMPGDFVLIKGSRALSMERVLDELVERIGVEG